MGRRVVLGRKEGREDSFRKTDMGRKRRRRVEGGECIGIKEDDNMFVFVY